MCQWGAVEGGVSGGDGGLRIVVTHARECEEGAGNKNVKTAEDVTGHSEGETRGK